MTKLGKTYGIEKRGTPKGRGNITLLEIGWCAGFLEGEGSFTGGRGFTIKAGQRSREPLERLQLLLGGRIGTQSKGQLFRWSVSGPRARGVALTLYPLLSERRQEQIRGWIHQDSPERLRRGGGLS